MDAAADQAAVQGWHARGDGRPAAHRTGPVEGGKLGAQGGDGGGMVDHASIHVRYLF
ncbi:hypothetical protein [Nitrospirillum viridazoti]|uniref:hypothetical protein n=1 Tax=Nitrospirillum viridazoti TaxID=3144925 RepID=UPI001FE3C057|nr:hypothetical protein [Nitrospirillum amazonense]